MAAAIGLRTDYDGPGLRRQARSSTDANQTRRLLALAAVYDGASQTMAANTGCVGRRLGRDWAVEVDPAAVS